MGKKGVWCGVLMLNSKQGCSAARGDGRFGYMLLHECDVLLRYRLIRAHDLEMGRGAGRRDFGEGPRIVS